MCFEIAIQENPGMSVTILISNSTFIYSTALAATSDRILKYFTSNVGLHTGATTDSA